MKRVWVVDDAIPYAMHAGGMPVPAGIEREALRFLLGKEGWEEQEVKDLCGLLCGDESYELAFFVSPDLMRRRLALGVTPPDVVVFDWEYSGSTDAKNIEALSLLLSKCAALVQVYTHLGGNAVDPKLVELRAKHPNRVLKALGKGDVKPDALSDLVKNAWAGTIAGAVADTVRQHTRAAVEQTLIELGSIPQSALAALAEKKQDNLLSLVLARVRDEVGEQAADAFQEMVTGGDSATEQEGIRKLLSVWYYFFPMDSRVRRGDLVEVNGRRGIVVTPPCDLASFNKKAAGRLTWLKVAAITDTEKRRLAELGCPPSKGTLGNSIIAGHGAADDAVVLLPNVPVKARDRSELIDHLLYTHAWESIELAVREGGPLSYPLDGITRVCTLAEPFASAVIAYAAAVISSPGVPNLPKGEIARLTKVVSPAAPATAGATPQAAPASGG